MPLSPKEDALIIGGLIGIGVSISFLISKKIKYKPGKVWSPPKDVGGKFGGMNRPTAGPRSESTLPRGKHALQLHSYGTPNGIKVTGLLEELHVLYGLEYDAHLIDFMNLEQFTSGFCNANPNSKIPALLHYEEGGSSDGNDTTLPHRVFESSAIMLYLCEKFDKEHKLLPDPSDPMYAECLSWVFFVHGSAPFLGGGFGHFFSYAPESFEYPINRYTLEVKRQLDVLNRRLGGLDTKGQYGSGGPYICGNQVSVADFACWPWYGALVLGDLYKGSAEFLQAHEYTHVMKWANKMKDRVSIKRGTKVNRRDGLLERHNVSDFYDLKL